MRAVLDDTNADAPALMQGPSSFGTQRAPH